MPNPLAAPTAAQAATLPPSVLRHRDDVPGPEAWRRAGIPGSAVDDVFVPFLSGVVLERDLTASRRFLDLMIRMFARARAAVPAGGMPRVPEHLAVARPAGDARGRRGRVAARLRGQDTAGWELVASYDIPHALLADLFAGRRGCYEPGGA